MRTLDELWSWAWREGKDAALEAPDRIHARYPYPDKDDAAPDTLLHVHRGTTQRTRPASIVGPPFSRAFIRYLDNGRAMTPARRALLDLRPKTGPWTLEFRILWAIIEGGHSAEGTLLPILGCRPELLRTAAHRALAHLYDKTQRVIAEEPKRTKDESKEGLALNRQKPQGSVRGRQASARRNDPDPTGRPRESGLRSGVSAYPKTRRSVA